MLIPEIMPDEFVSGYLLRLAAINGYRYDRAFIDTLQKYLGFTPEHPSHMNLFEIISHAVRLDLPEFIKRHTLIPYRKAVSPYIGIDRPDCSTWQPTALVARDLTLYKYDLYSCPECESIDLDILGYKYIKRMHQLPGVVHCVIHGNALAPASSKKNQDAHDFMFAIENYGHPIVSRYTNISFALLYLSQPLSNLRVVAAIRTATNEMGYGMTVNTKKPPLNKLANAICPIDWLGQFARKYHLHRGVYADINFDCVLALSQNASTRRYALALALLFKSAEDAINTVAAETPIDVNSIFPLHHNLEDRCEQQSVS